VGKHGEGQEVQEASEQNDAWEKRFSPSPTLTVDTEKLEDLMMTVLKNEQEILSTTDLVDPQNPSRAVATEKLLDTLGKLKSKGV
jgi:hypothetical protein